MLLVRVNLAAIRSLRGEIIREICPRLQNLASFGTNYIEGEKPHKQEVVLAHTDINSINFTFKYILDVRRSLLVVESREVRTKRLHNVSKALLHASKF